MRELFERELPHYEVPIELVRKSLRDKIAAEEEFMKSEHQSSDQDGRSPHFNQRNLLMDAVENFETIIKEAQGDRQKLHNLIKQKIIEYNGALSSYSQPEKGIALTRINASAKARWLSQCQQLQHKSKIWETIFEETFPQG